MPTTTPEKTPFCQEVPGGELVCATMATAKVLNDELMDKAIVDVVAGTTDPNPFGIASIAAAIGDQTLNLTAGLGNDTEEFVASITPCLTCPLAAVCPRPEV